MIYIFVVRRGAPPSNCDITKALWREYYSENAEADCGSDIEFKNEKNCAYDENNWRLTLTTISLRRFGALRPL